MIKIFPFLLSYFIIPSALAQTPITFTQEEVDQERFIALVVPHAQSDPQLVIIEQISDARPCWKVTDETTPTVVEALLLNFNFTGICNRATDSNGYSVRVGNEEGALKYKLKIEEQGGTYVLTALNRKGTSPNLMIGNTGGICTSLCKLELEPGWRFTHRVYQDKVLPHIYLTSN